MKIQDCASTAAADVTARLFFYPGAVPPEETMSEGSQPQAPSYCLRTRA